MSADQTNTAEAVERPTVDEARLSLSRHLAHLASIEPSLLTPVETVRLKALSVFIESHDRLRSRIMDLEKALDAAVRGDLGWLAAARVLTEARK